KETDPTDRQGLQLTAETPPSTRFWPRHWTLSSRLASALGKYPPHHQPSALLFISTPSQPAAPFALPLSPFLSCTLSSTIATIYLQEHRAPTTRPVPLVSTSSK
ncbi:hypothetical protein COCVIDRAFT_95386, partial [Bipolaris victoriae FI3]